MRLGLGVGEIASGAAKLEGAALVPEVLGLMGSFFFLHERKVKGQWARREDFGPARKKEKN